MSDIGATLVDRTGSDNQPLRDFLRDFARSSYWYGEDDGDYDMRYVHLEDWFQDAERELHDIFRRQTEDNGQSVAAQPARS